MKIGKKLSEAHKKHLRDAALRFWNDNQTRIVLQYQKEVNVFEKLCKKGDEGNCLKYLEKRPKPK